MEELTRGANVKKYYQSKLMTFTTILESMKPKAKALINQTAATKRKPQKVVANIQNSSAEPELLNGSYNHNGHS